MKHRHPALAWQYSGAGTPPPDTVRKPATITDVASALGLLHETVRRRFRHYRELGWVTRVSAGYLLTMERQQHPNVLGTGLIVSQRCVQLLQSLRQIGVCPPAPAARPATGPYSTQPPFTSPPPV